MKHNKPITYTLLILEGFFLSFATTHNHFQASQLAITISWIISMVIACTLLAIAIKTIDEQIEEDNKQ